MASWLWHAIRQVVPEGVPPNWRPPELALRSYNSQYYCHPFMGRLRDETAIMLETLTQVLKRSAAETIRQLIAQARLEDFLQS
jgi:hypothetical protein